MNRKSFLKNLTITASGALILSCKDGVESSLTPASKIDDISIDEAKNFFENSYLDKFAALREQGSKKHARKALWDRSEKLKDSKKQDYVWVPIEYDGDERPVVLFSDEKTLYRKELAKRYIQPIIEGLVVIKQKGELSAFLAQVTYDAFEYRKVKKFTWENFSGSLLRADWDDNLIDGIIYNRGKVIDSLSNSATKNGRVADCTWIDVSYKTVVVTPCGPNCLNVEFTLHRASQLVCSGGGGFGGGGAGGGYGSGGGGGGGGSTSGGNGPISGQVRNSDSTVREVITLPGFNVQRAINDPSSRDRTV